ncbi:hypothetical protein PBI_SPORTO_51 [Arthrobacter phage Sporto]|nr:hypothetical protein PBI_SPORTO_51 [Arthrobacter phage Sporto]
MQLEVAKRRALQISARTGLKETTCLDLLLSGWNFNQKHDNEPDVWISPLGSLTLPPTASIPQVSVEDNVHPIHPKHAKVS